MCGVIIAVPPIISCQSQAIYDRIENDSERGVLPAVVVAMEAVARALHEQEVKAVVVKDEPQVVPATNI